MISYESYQNRIKKVAAVKNFLVRFRALILCALALILAGVTALLVVKGITTGSVLIPSELVYGEEYSPEGVSAIMSSVEYEYSRAGSEEWTREKPTAAGSYFVRGVSQRSFNTSGYSAAVAFVIKPLDVEFVIRDSRLTYGDIPSSYEFPLIRGDRAVKDSLAFIYDECDAKETAMRLDASVLKILDTQGNEVTHCYNVSAPSKEVTLTERTIIVSPVALTATYNGKALSYEGGVSKQTAARLANGDTIAIETQLKNSAGTVLTGNPVEAGDYTAEVVSYRIMKGSVDVTGQYAVSLASARLTVSKRPVRFTFASARKVYDGTPLSAQKVDSVGGDGLADSHTYSILGQLVSCTDAGSVGNSYEVMILDGAGRDVTQNYALAYTRGTLTVLRREITISTGSAEKIYDGDPLVEHTVNVTQGTLVSQHRLEVISFASRTEAGTSGNSNRYRIRDGGGNDCTDNYSITENAGSLTVRPREIIVTTASATKTYDGTPLTKTDGFTYDRALTVADHVIVFDSSSKPASVTDAEIPTENKLSFRVRTGGGTDVTRNYNIILSEKCGTLLVKKLEVVIDTHDLTAVYHGAPQSQTNKSVNLKNVGDRLVSSHIFVPVRATEQTDVTGAKGVANNVTFTVADSYGNDVSRNYSIEYGAKGVIVIEPRPASVTVNSGTKIYDGTPLSERSAYAENLAAGQRVELLGETVSRAEAGTTENIYAYKIVDSQGKDATHNYIVTYKSGLLEVTKRSASVTVNSNAKTYDGVPLTERTAHALNLAAGQRVELLGETVSITDFGTKENTYAYKIVDGNGTDRTHNYNVTYRSGTLEITKRYVGITVDSAEKVYDGTPLVKRSATVTAGSLVSGQSVELLGDNVSLTNVGETENSYTYRIVDAAKTETTGNYTVVFTAGKLTVTVREVTLTFASAVREYNGKPLSARSATVTKGSLAPDQTLKLLGNDVAITDAGTQDNIYEYEILGANGGDVSANYSVTAIKGTLTVTPKSVSVRTAEGRKVYDGTPLTKTDGFIYDKSEMIADHVIVLKEGAPIASVTDAAVPMLNILEFTVQTAGGTDVSRNYKLTVTYGTLLISHLQVKIVTADLTETYNGYVFTQTEKTVTPLNGKLVEGHVFMPVSYTLISDVTGDKGVSNVVRYEVYDETVTDVSRNYSLSYEYGTIIIKPRPIAVTTQSNSFEYNGKPQSELSCNADGLLTELGHELHANAGYATVTDVKEGEVENVVSYYVWDGTRDISFNYAFSYTYGYISVYARSIIVQTATNSFEYDGTPHSDPSYTVVANSLVSGHILKPVGNIPTVTEVGEGEVTNEIAYAVYEQATDRSVNENYAISYAEYGKISVYARTVLVVTSDGEWTYDGDQHFQTSGIRVYCSDGTGKGLVGDHALSVKSYATVTDVRDTFEHNNVIEVAIVSGKGSVSENYAIEYLYGTLTITPRKIIVRPYHLYSVPSLDVVYGEPYEYPVQEGNYHGVIGEGLVQNETLTVLSVYYTAENSADGKRVTPKNAGNYNIWGETYKVTKDGADEDYTDNYEISSTNGILRIRQREVRVQLGEFAGKVYDGKILYFGDERFTIHSDSTGLDYYASTNFTFPDEGYQPVEGDEFFLAYEYYFDSNTSISVSQLLTGHKTVNEPRNAGTYAVHPIMYYVRSAGSETANDNYTVSLVGYDEENPPVFVIERCRVEIGLSNAEKIYDGTPFDYLDEHEITVTVIRGAIADGTDLFFSMMYIDSTGELVTPIHAGTYKMYVSVAITCNPNKDSHDNYYFYQSPSPARITITPREVSFAVEDDTAVYNAQAYNYLAHKGISVSCNLAGVTATADVTYYDEEGNQITRAIDAGTYGIGVDAQTIKILLNSREDLLTNYDFTFTPTTASLTITPRPLSVVLEDDEKTYDGEEYEYLLTHHMEFGNVPEGITLLLTGYVFYYDANGVRMGNPEDAGTYGMRFSYNNWDLSGDKKSNYSVSIEDCPMAALVIHQRKISVTPLTLDPITYGETFEYPVYSGNYESIGGEGLVDDDVLTVHNVYYTTVNDRAAERVVPKNAGTYYVWVSAFTVLDEYYYEDSGGNYEVVSESAELTILPKEIHILLGSVEGKVYDGKYLTFGSTNFTYPDEDYMPVYGDAIFVAFNYRYSPRTDITLSEMLRGNCDIVYVAKDAGTYAAYPETFIAIDAQGAIYESENYQVVVKDFFTQEHPYVNLPVFVIERLQVGLALTDAEKIYDGTPFDYLTEYSLEVNVLNGTMPNGVTLTPSIVYFNAESEAVTPVNALTYKMEISAVTPVGDIAGNFEITPTGAVLKILPREVSFAVEDDTAVYNAQAYNYLAHKGISVSCNLAGVTAAADVAYYDEEGNLIAKAIDAGSYGIVVDAETIVIFLNGEEDLLANYNFTFEPTFAMLTIAPRPLTVKIFDDEMKYNGAPYSGYDLGAEFGNVPNGVSLDFDFTVTICNAFGEQVEAVNVGTYFLKFGSEWSLLGDKQSNYTISEEDCTSGTLTITPRKISISLYTFQSMSSLYVIYGDSYEYPIQAGNYRGIYGDGLVTGETFTITGVYYTLSALETDERVTPKDVGTYAVLIDSYLVHKNGEDADYSYNYEITDVDRGILKIIPKAVHIELGSVSDKIYDGETLGFGSTNFSYPEEKYMPIEGESLSLGYQYYFNPRTDISLEELLQDYEVVTAPKDAGTYAVIISGYTAYYADGTAYDALKNYYILATNYDAEHPPVFVIEPCKLYLALFDKHTVYKGTGYDYFAQGGSMRYRLLNGGAIPSGVSFTSEVFYTDSLGNTVSAPLDAGVYQMEMGEVSVSGDLISNYEFVITVGAKLEIEKRCINVAVSDVMEEYGVVIDPEANTYRSERTTGGEGFVSVDGLRDDLAGEIFFTYSQNGVSVENPVERGTYEISVQFVGERMDNYIIEQNTNGTLTITGRLIAVLATERDSVEYNAQEVSGTDNGFVSYHVKRNADGTYSALPETGFVDGEESLQVSYGYFLNGAKTPAINAATYQIRVFFGNLSDEYEIVPIEWVDGLDYTTFTITPRPITVITGSNDDDSNIYNNSLYNVSVVGYTDYYTADRTQSGFVGGDKALFDSVMQYVTPNRPVNAGSYSVSYAFTDATSPVCTNYAYTSVSGTFTIHPREITVYPKPYSEKYVGQQISLPSDSYTIASGSLADGDSLSVTGSGVLNATQKKLMQVTIASVRVYDTASGSGSRYGGTLTENYRVTYRYDPETMPASMKSSFMALLQFETRSVEVTPTTIAEGGLAGTVLPYTGKSHTFELPEDTATLFRIVSGSELLEGDSIVVIKAAVNSLPGEKTNWLTFAVYDAYGNNVTNGYSIQTTAGFTVRVEGITLDATVLLDSAHTYSVSDVVLSGNASDYVSAEYRALVAKHLLEITVAEITYGADGAIESVSFAYEIFTTITSSAAEQDIRVSQLRYYEDVNIGYLLV